MTAVWLGEGLNLPMSSQVGPFQVFLASDTASNITGQVIQVTGAEISNG
jgi:enoyl-[acyl-carrier-protein] reductase (NADH)